jgi:O-antigen/teichoic acid export membrane protein
VALIAQAHGRRDDAEVQRTYDVLGTVAILTGLVLCGVVVVVGPAFMPHEPRAMLAFGLAAIGAAAGVWRTLPSQALLAVHQIRASTVITIVASFLGAVLICAGTYAYGVMGQLVATAGAALVAWPVGIAIAKRAWPIVRMTPRPRIDGAVLRKATAIGGASLVAGLSMQGALSIVRWALDRTGGTEDNGQYQAAWLVGTNYLTVVLASLGSVVFPRYAAADGPAALEASVEEAGRFMMRVAPPVVLIGIALRAPAIRVLYSDRFGPAAEVLGIMMAGDVAKAVAFVQAGPLLYRGHVRTFIAGEVISAAFQAVAALVLVPRLGPLGAAWACTLNYVLYAIASAYVVERACGISVNRKRTWASVLFAAFAVGCVYATSGRLVAQVALLAVAVVLAHRAGLLRAAWGRARRLLGRGDRG